MKVVAFASALTVLSIVSSGCGEQGGCGFSDGNGLFVSVFNASTTARVCDATVTLTATDGSVFGLRLDTSHDLEGCTYTSDPPGGTYTLTATAPTFQTLSEPTALHATGSCSEVSQNINVNIIPSQ